MIIKTQIKKEIKSPRRVFSQRRKSPTRMKSPQRRKSPRVMSKQMILEKWDPSSYRDKLPNKCFLDSPRRKYPICNSKGDVSLQGLKAAKLRAILVSNNKKVNSSSRKKAGKVKAKAQKLLKKYGS